MFSGLQGMLTLQRMEARRHLPTEFLAAQRLRTSSNVMLQVPVPTPRKPGMDRTKTLGDDGGGGGKGLPASLSLPADAAAVRRTAPFRGLCLGQSWLAACCACC